MLVAALGGAVVKGEGRGEIYKNYQEHGQVERNHNNNSFIKVGVLRLILLLLGSVHLGRARGGPILSRGLSRHFDHEGEDRESDAEELSCIVDQF